MCEPQPVDPLFKVGKGGIEWMHVRPMSEREKKCLHTPGLPIMI